MAASPHLTPVASARCVPEVCKRVCAGSKTGGGGGAEIRGKARPPRASNPLTPAAGSALTHTLYVEGAGRRKRSVARFFSQHAASRFRFPPPQRLQPPVFC